MLRLLARNAVERSIAVHRKTPTRDASALSFSRHQHTRNVIPRSLPRSMSSSVPPTKTTSSKAPESIPPNSPTTRKPKVELRPGPIKPTDPARPPIAPATSVQKSPAKIPVNEASSAPSSPSQLSVTETTKQDVADAIKHGLLVSPPAHYGRFRQLLHQAIQLAKFYWRGVKLLNVNRIHVGEIRKRIEQGGPPISRWENRFIRTFRQDTLKLIPFVIIVLVLEEIIPLIAIYAPFMLPSTCILPSQRDRIESAKANKQIAAADLYRSIYENILLKEVGGHIPLASLRGDNASTQALCMLLRLPTWGSNGLRVRRMRRHLRQVAKDDELLMQEDKGGRLAQLELLEALHERGIITVGLGPRDQELRLKWWLNSTNQVDGGDPVTVRILAVARSGASRSRWEM